MDKDMFLFLRSAVDPGGLSGEAGAGSADIPRALPGTRAGSRATPGPEKLGSP